MDCKNDAIVRAEAELEEMISTSNTNDEFLTGMYINGDHWHYHKDAERMERYYKFVIPWQMEVIEGLKHKQFEERKYHSEK